MSSLSNVIEFPIRGDREGGLESRPVVVAERQRIARELHDVVASGFATISLQAGVAVDVLEEQPQQAVDALRAIRAASKEALDDLRAILGMLRSADAGPHAYGPGLGRLDALVARMIAAGLSTRIHLVGRPHPLPAAVDLAAYRIVQESLTNVLRHAGRASVVVTITYRRDRLTVEVEDDGSGSAADSSRSEGSGHGIVGMRERVSALGGELEAQPLSEGGFRVRASLPVLGRP
jgi:signal transduction histidine kinase